MCSRTAGRSGRDGVEAAGSAGGFLVGFRRQIAAGKGRGETKALWPSASWGIQLVEESPAVTIPHLDAGFIARDPATRCGLCCVRLEKRFEGHPRRLG